MEPDPASSPRAATRKEQERPEDSRSGGPRRKPVRRRHDVSPDLDLSRLIATAGTLAV